MLLYQSFYICGYIGYNVESVAQCATDVIHSFFSLSGIYTERKKKRRANFIPKFHSSLKSLLNILLWLQNGTCMEQKFQISLVCDQQVSSYWSSLVATPQILKSKWNWKSISGVPPSSCRCCPNSPLDRVNQSIDSSHRDVIPFIDQRIP